jgi:hypothetical protein
MPEFGSSSAPGLLPFDSCPPLFWNANLSFHQPQCPEFRLCDFPACGRNHTPMSKGGNFTVNLNSISTLSAQQCGMQPSRLVQNHALSDFGIVCSRQPQLPFPFFLELMNGLGSRLPNFFYACNARADPSLISSEYPAGTLCLSGIFSLATRLHHSPAAREVSPS